MFIYKIIKLIEAFRAFENFDVIRLKPHALMFRELETSEVKHLRYIRQSAFAGLDVAAFDLAEALRREAGGLRKLVLAHVDQCARGADLAACDHLYPELT